jgi:hypothetical protein
VGAADGAGYQVLPKGSTVKAPSGTKIDFTLAAPLNLAMIRLSFSSIVDLLVVCFGGSR